MVRLATLALLLALLTGCGGEVDTPTPPREGAADPVPKEPAPAPAPAPKATPDLRKQGSAFLLIGSPERVESTLDMSLFRKGVRRPDPRDAIPAILEPRFVAAKDVTFMRPERRVITLRVGEEIRAYPLHILDRHELVNDVVGGKQVLVTWCPLCGSTLVYDRVVRGTTLTFGVSGYLYKSDVLMYDHQTESFWSQLELRAVAGPQTGNELTVLPSMVTSFGAFKGKYPEAKVLSDDQGIVPPHEYVRQVYLGYDKMPRVYFPVGTQSKALFSKAEVVGVVVNGKARAYALKALRTLSKPWEDKVGGASVVLTYEAAGDAISVRQDGKLMAHQRMFWFAWYAFHPDTDLRTTLDGPVLEKPGEVTAEPQKKAAPLGK